MAQTTLEILIKANAAQANQVLDSLRQQMAMVQKQTANLGATTVTPSVVNGAGATKVIDDTKRKLVEVQKEAEKLPKVIAPGKKAVEDLGKEFTVVKAESASAMKQAGLGAASLRTSIIGATIAILAMQTASRVVGSIVSQFKDGIRAVEDFEHQVIGMSASLTSLDKNTTIENVAQQYQRMTGFVRGQIEEIIKLDALYSGTGQELTRVYDVLLAKGIVVNTQIKEQREGFLAMAEALKFATRGQNFDMQVFQEINGLLDGTRISTLRLTQFLGLAGAEADKFRQRLMGAKDASERGAILMEMMRTRAAGFVVASKEMGNTLTGVVSSLQSTWNIIQRQAFAGAWKDIAGWVRQINGALRDQDGNLTALGQSIVNNIKGAWDAVKGAIEGVSRAIQDPETQKALGFIWRTLTAIWDTARNVGSAIDAIRFNPGFFAMIRWVLARLEEMAAKMREISNFRIPNGWGWVKGVPTIGPILGMLEGDEKPTLASTLAARLAGERDRTRVPEVEPNPRGNTGGGKGGDGGSRARKDPNAELREAFSRAVQTSQLIADRDNQTTEQQIKNLRKIYAEYSRTGALRKALAMELLALEARIASMERQRIDEQISKSREFIAHRKAMNQMSAQEEIAAQRRILATPGISRDERVRALREIDLIQKRQRDEAREAQQKAWDEARRLLQERVDAEERAAEEIIDIRRRIADATAASSLDEFAARRREIDREYNELLERLTATRSSNPNFQADTEAAAGAMTAAKARVDRDEALANLRKQLDASQALLDLEEERLRIGEGSAEAVTAARQAYLDQLTASMQLAETEAERLRILMQIAGIQSQIKMDSIRNDFKASLDYVTSEFQKRRFDWLTAMQTAAGDMERAMSDGFFKVMQGNLSGLSDIFGGILAAIQRQIANWLASQIVQQFLGIVNGGMGGGGGAGGGGALMQIFTGLIPGMAKGGVVFGPQMIMAGEGAEPEAIIPLSKLPTLARQAGGGGGPIVMQFNIQANDAGSFVEMAQRSRHGLADVVMSALNENNSLRRMLPDYR